MKLQNQTAVKIEPQYGPAAVDAYLESEAAANRMGDGVKMPAACWVSSLKARPCP